MKNSNRILLIFFIILAVALNFLPHLNYPYPLHVDEWVHYQYSNHLSSNSSLYFGGMYGTNLEAGFHYILSTLNAIGVPYLFMFNFFASVISVLICLGVFILTRRIFNETAGVFSVFFIAILESSVMILGTVFFVPMAIGLFLIAIGLFLVAIESRAWILVLASVLIIHPPSALAFLLLINIEFILLKKNYLKNIILQAIAIVIALPFYLSTLFSKGIDTIESLKFVPISGLIFVPRYLGWIVIALVLAGVYFSAEKKKFPYILYSIGLLFFIFLFYNFKIEVFIPYSRALMYLFLVFAVLFGYGFENIVNIFKDKKIRGIISVVLIVFVLYFALPAKLDSNNYFYHIINDKEYNDFIWIRENTDKNAIILADPWISNAITPIAERSVYSRIVQGPNEKYESRNKEIKDFFESNCTNGNFLKENNITMVYDYERKCINSGLKQIHERVFEVG